MDALITKNDIEGVLEAKLNAYTPEKFGELAASAVFRKRVTALMIDMYVQTMGMQGHIAAQPAPKSILARPSPPPKPVAAVFAAKPYAQLAAGLTIAAPIKKTTDRAVESKLIVPPWMNVQNIYDDEEVGTLYLLAAHDIFTSNNGRFTDIRFMLMMAVGHVFMSQTNQNGSYGSYFRAATYGDHTFAVPSGWKEVSCNKGRYRVFLPPKIIDGHAFALNTSMKAKSPYMWFIVKENETGFDPVSPQDANFLNAVRFFLQDGKYQRPPVAKADPEIPTSAFVLPDRKMIRDDVPKAPKPLKNGVHVEPIAGKNRYDPLEDSDEASPVNAAGAAAAGIAPTLDSDEEPDNAHATDAELAAVANGNGSWVNAA